MADFAILKKGDHLPTVGVLQRRLNTFDAKLRVDGIFGPRTERAVTEFQRDHRYMGDGVVTQATFELLFPEEQLPIVDCVDIFSHDQYTGEAADIIKAGGAPLLLGGMSQGVLQAATDLQTYRDVFLLRFIGHGRGGMQAIASGTGGFGDQHSNLYFRVAHEMAPLRTSGFFGAYASVQMHGCRVGLGDRGRHFVNLMANLWGVPVTAGVGYQSSTFAFDGPTVTGMPYGLTLRQWCADLPAFPRMSIGRGR